MKFFTLPMIFFLFTPYVFGRIEKNIPSEFQVVPLNSPVKEVTAKFALKAPRGFDIQSVKFRVQKSSDVLIKDNSYSPIKLISGPTAQELHIPIEGATPGFYRLFVKVISKKDQDKEQEFKSAYKDFVSFIVAEKTSHVQMPDSSLNKSTLGGVDTDQNGIRDDIQIWINKKFAQKPNLKNGMQQMASALQTQILSTSNKELSILSTYNFLRSMRCVGALVTLDETMRLKNSLKNEALNTKDRLYAEIKANEHFSGQGYSVSIDPEYMRSQCDF